MNQGYSTVELKTELLKRVRTYSEGLAKGFPDKRVAGAMLREIGERAIQLRNPRPLRKRGSYEEDLDSDTIDVEEQMTAAAIVAGHFSRGNLGVLRRLNKFYCAKGNSALGALDEVERRVRDASERSGRFPSKDVVYGAIENVTRSTIDEQIILPGVPASRALETQKRLDAIDMEGLVESGSYFIGAEQYI